MSDDDIREPHLRKGDFLGVFAVVRSERGILFVENRRKIGGSWRSTWDLPGGQVEPREMLHEALQRELEEEISVGSRGTPELLFLQEGDRVIKRRRRYAWRSFFFGIDELAGEPQASSEVLGLRWLQPDELPAILTAPYHDSFLEWLRVGGTHFRSTWRD